MISDRGGEYYGKYTENGQAHGAFAKFLQEPSTLCLVFQIRMVWQKEETEL